MNKKLNDDLIDWIHKYNIGMDALTDLETILDNNVGVQHEKKRTSKARNKAAITRQSNKSSPKG